jgi:hypothetical protein
MRRGNQKVQRKTTNGGEDAMNFDAVPLHSYF